MAKNMARLESGVVVNIEWCSDLTTETDTLKDMGDCAVAVGDVYENGKFYHDGIEVVTPLESAMLLIKDMQSALNKLGVVV